MEEGKGFISNGKNVERDEVFSKSVRAGKRTYFFDVKATRKNEYYLTITESKKRFNKEGRYFYEKHKIFLYKEDFDKFKDGLTEVLDFIQNSQGQGIQEAAVEPEIENSQEKDYTDVDFEDLEVSVAAESSREE